MILTKEEFAAHFNALKEGLGNDNSPLWEPDATDGVPCKWFVCVSPLGVFRFKYDYWRWCNTTLHGKVACFSSNREDLEEWWGFTRKEDIALWMLKWM